jgi:hypothetical protein
MTRCADGSDSAKTWADSGGAAISYGMSAVQEYLFGTASHIGEQPSAEIVALVRTRLHATLALVKSADAMPWPDQLAIIREDNAFRYGKDVLPRAEGAALWAEFDAEMNRLYAIMNEGKEPDRGD